MAKNGNGKPDLTESQMRHLTRVANLMRAGANVELRIRLDAGGVRDYHEGWSPKGPELDTPDADLMLALLAGG